MSTETTPVVANPATAPDLSGLNEDALTRLREEAEAELRRRGTGDMLMTYVLDRSGSMAGIWADTVGGFETLVREQAEQEGAALLTLIAFDTAEGRPQLEMPYRAERMRDVPGFPAGIKPRGSTPLYDAIAEAIRITDEWLRTHAWFGGKVLVAINTDGMENASREQTHESITALIKERRQRGWEFTFIAANMDAPRVAASMGMSAQSSKTYAATGAAAASTHRHLSDSVTAWRSGKDAHVNLGDTPRSGSRS